jgi:hypothetical protein
MTTLLKRSLFILCMMGLTSSLATMGYAAGPDLNEASNKKILVGALVKGTQQVNFTTATGTEKFQIYIENQEKSKIQKLNNFAGAANLLTDENLSKFTITEDLETPKAANHSTYAYYTCVMDLSENTKNKEKFFQDEANRKFAFQISPINPAPIAAPVADPALAVDPTPAEAPAAE